MDEDQKQSSPHWEGLNIRAKNEAHLGISILKNLSAIDLLSGSCIQLEWEFRQLSLGNVHGCFQDEEGHAFSTWRGCE